MRALLTFVLVLMFALPAIAEGAKERYWVLGSFKTVDAAVSESRRIQDAIGVPVDIAKFDVSGGTLYRLVVKQGADPESQKSMLAGAGVEPWSVPLSGWDLDFVKPAEVREVEYVLVVGSFNQADHADTFANELAARGLPTAHTMSGDSSMYRVVAGPYGWKDESVKTQATAAGVEGAWWLAVQAAPMPEPEPVVEETPEPAPVEVAESEPVKPPLRTPRAGETWLEFCINRATPEERDAYCKDNAFSKNAIAEQRVIQGARGEVYFDFCVNQATPEQRQKYCSDAAFAQRATE
ncbi:MAG: SPOR domain-containing protein [Pseudomonadales bacterium]|nr:SPOR domain-containing protein [Pseudomonadales bacterium]